MTSCPTGLLRPCYWRRPTAPSAPAPSSASNPLSPGFSTGCESRSPGRQGGSTKPECRKTPPATVSKILLLLLSKIRPLFIIKKCLMRVLNSRPSPYERDVITTTPIRQITQTTILFN